MFKKIAIFIILILFVLVLTNPNMDDFKDFSQANEIIYKQKEKESEESGNFIFCQKRERNYFLFSFYSYYIRFETKYGDYTLQSERYLGILNNFYFIEPDRFYYDEKGIVRVR
jgi:hypothetical protein